MTETAPERPALCLNCGAVLREGVIHGTVRFDGYPPVRLTADGLICPACGRQELAASVIAIRVWAHGVMAASTIIGRTAPAVSR